MRGGPSTPDALALGEAPRRSRWPGTASLDSWALLLLPALLTLTAVFFLPLLILASNSLHPNAGMGMVAPQWTLENYWDFVTDSFYLGVLLDTFVLGGIVVTICMVVGYPVAYFLARSQWRWKAALIFIVVSPLLISAVIRNIGWVPVLGNNGAVNWALMKTGLLREPVQLVGNFTGVVIGLVHALLPLMILSIMTVIQRIEPEVEEASINLGASPLATFWRVLLPLSRPGLLSGYLLVLTIAISAFVTPGMLGGKRVLVMATYIDQQIRTVLNYPFAATAAIVLMLAAGALTLVALRLPNKGE